MPGDGPGTSEILSRVFSRFQGPGHLRFIVQPLVAILLGVRDGIRDAKEGRPPYFLHLLSARGQRRDSFRDGVVAISKPLLIAFVMDSFFQIQVLGRWSPLGALIVAALFIATPYIAARGLANRIASRKRRHE